MPFKLQKWVPQILSWFIIPLLFTTEYFNTCVTTGTVHVMATQQINFLETGYESLVKKGD
jgi:hypothetical protein